MALSLAEVLVRAREGEAEAFALIYDRYSRFIHSYAYRLLGNQTQADDVTQDTFLRAWQRLGQLRDDSRLESWLYAIASNLCTDVLRRRRLISWLPLGPKHEALPDDCSELAGALAEHDLVRRVLRDLPPTYAVPLVLRHVEGFSCPEIAEILDISVDNVWQRLSRARELFVKTYSRLSKGHSP
jgi:RNA polymerase sigma-70 factor (ECF subfamily)